MLGVSQSQNELRSKSLSEAFPESKTPEIEEIDEELAEKKYSDDERASSELIIDRRLMSSVSVRSSQIKDSLSAKGDIISAVVLNTDGTLTQIEYDTTPSAKNANRVLGARFTIVGFIEECNLLILRGLNSASNELNRHQLPSPLSKLSFNGVYLCFKIDANGNPVSFTCEDYLAISKDSANDEDDEQSVESQSNNAWDRFVEEVRESVVSTFIRTKGYQPSEDEITDSVNATIERTVDVMVSKYDSNVCDEDYRPESDMDELSSNMPVMVMKSSSEEDISDVNDELTREERRELDLALGGIRELAQMRGREMFSNIKSKYNVNEMDFTAAACEAQDFEFRAVDENELNNKDEFNALKSDAMEYVRLCAQRDGKYLANFICDTFVELNGNECSLNDLRDVFADISYSLEMEAEDELNDDNDEMDDDTTAAMVVNDRLIDDGSAYAMSRRIKDLNTLTPNELIEYSYRIVREDLIGQAQSHYRIINGNENLPTSEELTDIVNNLIDHTFIDTMEDVNIILSDEDEKDESANDYSDSENDDSTYNPESDYENERELYEDDELENEQFEADCEDRHIFDTENEFVTTTVIESKYGNGERYNLYFNSMQSDEINELNLNSAIEAFRKFNDRLPTENEMEHLRKFLDQSEDIDRVYALRDSSSNIEEEEEEDNSSDYAENEEEKAEEEIDYEDTIDID